MSITPPSQTQQHVAPHLPPAEFVCDTAAEFEASLDELCVSLGLQATKMFTVARERCAELAELKRAALAIEARQIVRMAALKKVTAVIVDNKRAAEPPAAAPPASRRRMLVVASPPKAPFIRRRSRMSWWSASSCAKATGAPTRPPPGFRWQGALIPHGTGGWSQPAKGTGPNGQGG